MVRVGLLMRIEELWWLPEDEVDGELGLNLRERDTWVLFTVSWIG